MTDKEIIKALECCIHQQLCAFDDGKCSYFDKSYVGRQLVIQNAYDLIKRQQAEIERLNDEKENLRCVIDDLCNNTEYAKSEAVKEFAERLKKKARVPKELWNVSENKKICERDIDEVLKEMEAKI